MKKLLYAFLSIALWVCVPQIAKAQLIANFTATPVTGCSPIVVQFTDQSTGNPTSWSWDLGNGTLSALQNPSTTYITPGTYTVTLTVTNGGNSNTHTITNYITVLPQPVVNFVVNDSSVSCPPKTVQFTNLSTPGGNGAPSYQWDFGDGTSSTLASPSHTYNTVGTYNVTLSVTNGSGCTNSLTKTGDIQLVAKPTASFTANNTYFCKAPATVAFTNTSTGATTYSWNFGDGATSTAASPAHTYNSTGFYTVTLIATNAAGCSDTLIQSNYIYIYNIHSIFTGPATACVGANVTFINASTPASGSNFWIFGDGGTSTNTNGVHAYATAGTYTVKLVYTANSCSDTSTQTITISPSPTASFTASGTYSCAPPFTVNFTNTSTGGATYAWSFGDGGTSTLVSPSHTYNTYGSFTVSLTVTSAAGCSAVLTMPAYIVVQAPVATITASPSTGCAPLIVSFATTLGPVNSPVTPVIHFGDGTSVNATSGIHTYSTPGTYTVTYTGTVPGGCSYSATTTVIVGAPPVPGFTSAPDTICVGNSVSFTNTSTGATSYTWLFGDGGTSNAANPSHVYGGPGLYTVTLIATNSYCSDTLVRTNLILVLNPLANFSAALTNCADRYTFTFTNTSVGNTSSSWAFGDGGTSASNATTVQHTYAAYGTYTVTLTVTNAVTGCINVKTLTLPVFPLIDTFNASTTTICKGNPIIFTAYTNGYYTNFAWTFGDGINSNGGNNVISHTYNNPGTYSVKLVITDVYGCRDTLNRPAYIQVGGPTVLINASPYFGCPGLVVNFTDAGSTYGVGNTVISRNWNFGDGNTNLGNNASVSHQYNTVGNFTASVTETDQLGCSGSNATTIYIATPSAHFTSPDTAICVGGTTSFNNTTTGAISYVWNFGDGGTSTATNPSHTYSTAGYYTVKLLATNSYGCQDSVARVAYIHVIGFQAGFTLSDTFATCPPLSVSVTATTPATITSFSWTFGNGSQSVAPNPSTLYTYPGVYHVKLIATNNIGCMDSVTKNVTVLGPTGSLSYNSVNGCLPVTVTLTATTQNASTITWDMNNGFTTTTATTPPITTYTYTYTTPGVFVPLIVLGNGSCQVSVRGIDTIKVDGVSANFSDTNTCAGSTVQFRDTIYSSLAPVTGRSWFFGDGGTNNIHNPTHTYTSAGTYTVMLIITNATGCHDTITKTIVIHPLPTITAANQTICANQVTPVQLSASGALYYTWSPATGLSCTNCANPTALPTVTTTYTVTGTDSFGCVNTHAVTVTVGPPPVLATSGNTSVCNGSGVTLTVSGATTYVWSPATGLSCTACANPVATPTATTTYTVTGSSGSCSGTASLTVTVNPLPTISAGSNVAICINSSATLHGTGGVSYTWSPATGLSCTSCASPVANPTATTTYTVDGTDANGCHNTSTVTVTVNPLPTITTTGTQTICSNQVTPVQLGASGGVTYTWSPATGLSCTNCANPTALPAVTTVYTVTGTSAAGCLGTGTVTITVSAPPVLATGGNPTICNGSSATVSVSGATTYAWSPATGLACTNCASTTASPGVTTTYTITGSNGTCSANTTITVTVNPLPAISGGSNVAICANTSTTLHGTGGVSYTWSPATGLSCTACASPVASPAATTTYTVTGTDANGCHNTSTVTVTINPLPTITTTGSQTICSNQVTPVQLGATGGTTYIWTPATGLSCTNCANPTALPAVTTVYTVTGTDANGCVGNGTATITVSPPPVVTTGGNSTICNGSSTVVSVSGATTYIWSPVTGLACTNCATTTASPAATTTYTITGTTGTCSANATITVTVNPLPTIGGGSNVAICANTSTTLQGTGGVSYTWSPATGLSCTACASPVASPAATTTYTVTGTDANGCHNTAAVTVTINPLPTITTTGSQTICSNQVTPVQLGATGGTTYIWTPATGLSCTNCANPTALPAVTTVYTVSGTDANGCVGSGTATITVSAPPVLATGGNPTICSGTSGTVSVTGATTYAWSPVTGLACTNCATTTASPAATTVYTITGSTGTCSASTTLTVTVNPLPVISGGNNVAICINSSTPLQATGGLSYTWSPATGLSCTACANPTASPTATTTYTVTGTDANGCNNTSTVTVTINPLPTITTTGSQTICSNQVTPAQLGASGGVTYTWSPATGLSCTNCANPTALPAVTTIYTVTGTNANGCVGAGTATVTVSAPPSLVTGGNPTICSGTSTPVSVTGATLYAWSPATGLACTNCATTTANPAATTTYTITGTTGTCTSSATLTVTVNPLPAISAGNNVAICRNSSAVLQATGGLSYTWSPAAGLSCTACAAPSASPTATTTYTVTGTDANGCHNTATITVTVNQLPVIAAANGAICPGGIAPLLATGGVSYIWSPATGLSCTACPNPNASPAATTIYTITGTDANGCINTVSATVTVNPIPVVTVSANPHICIGGSTPLVASGAASYTWSPATGLTCTNCANPTAHPTVTTTYTVVGINGTNCTDTNQVTVTVNPLPVVLAGPDTALCAGMSVHLNATGASAYVWSPAAGLSCTACAGPLATPNATTTYIVTGTDTNSCTNTAAATVTVHALPVIIQPAHTICVGSSVQLQATGATTYTWTPATGLSCTNCFNPLASPVTTTVYTINGTNIYGCTDSIHVTVTVDPLPNVSAGPDQVICNGYGAQLQATGATSYTWSPAAGLSCTYCANPLATPADTTTYTVIGTNGNGCNDTAHVTVNVLTKPNVTTGAGLSICAGNSAQLQASGATTYAWSPATGLSCTSCANPVASPVSPVTYTVIGSSGNGCSDTAEETVNIFTQPVISAGPALVVCNGSSDTLQATGGASYTWSPSTALSCTNCADPVTSPTADISYEVVGTDANGCVDSAKVDVTVIHQVAITVSANDTICMGHSVQLSATGGTGYLWIPSDGLSNDQVATPTATPDVTTTYTVVTTENKCFTDTGYVTVVVDSIPTVTLGGGEGLVAGGAIQLTPVTTGNITGYSWTPATSLSCADCRAPFASPQATTTYAVTVTSGVGCTATADITIQVGCDKSQVFIPNTFTPNGDGQNDYFFASGKGVSIIKRFSVYDRWGELVYQAENISVNDPQAGWDGTFKGQKVKPDVFVYIIDATCETGQPMEFKGDISLVR